MSLYALRNRCIPSVRLLEDMLAQGQPDINRACRSVVRASQVLVSQDVERAGYKLFDSDV